MLRLDTFLFSLQRAKAHAAIAMSQLHKADPDNNATNQHQTLLYASNFNFRFAYFRKPYMLYAFII